MSDTAKTAADGPPRPVVLCILDGWGEREGRDHNAIALAQTPNWDRLSATCPRARLDASAGEVGLPPGQMGNSEVGHMNLGGGRVVMQDLPRIDAAIADGSLGDSPALVAFVERLRESGGVCHLMGLLSPGGVHSHQDHMAALARIVASAGVPVATHAFLDGRDTPPSSALGYMREFSATLGDIPGASIATVSGRYYAMDRDTRWDRVEKAYVALTEALGERAPNAEAAIEASYGAGITDEFVAPTGVDGYAGMRDGDGLLMANFRADRAREILGALVDPAFDGFTRRRTPAFAARLGAVKYSERLKAHMDSIFVPLVLENFLGQVVAEAGLRQLRIAETEKYAHVTFFLNGGREESYAGEERILVPSPGVATYDLQPEMSAFQVTDKLVEAVASARFALVIVNYANGDMVGHTGDLAAAIKAAEAIDTCLGRLAAAVTEASGVLLITADHGNAETMRNPETGQPHTAHTLNLVPLVMVNAPPWVEGLRDGRLADVAPTVLRLMELGMPAEMSGRPLIEEEGVESDAAQ
ncbi:MAG: 2,3-bisphosphoglycerate-independent phosphoglycerate mutase [Rhodospirillales bacterium]|jgi:2,3-bisphosphoglycerate-independent phosphoglycerate mutase|nr:2,3-bisphosphoglycerate-independent phosphoglycerate mutase [Rhodospirillales bacterium]MDP6804790.1 2,3-bisphosphoglycerate-independent phosphoglycerate mutase [Rhodospirillales bacterium]